MIDSHAHLYLDAFDADLDHVFDRARAVGVEHFVVVGIDLATSRQALALAERRSDVSATAGIHPTDTGDLVERDWEELDQLLASGRFVGIGETGLDYYWDRSTPELQKEALARHFALARDHDLPVVIHCRDAWPDLLHEVEKNGSGTRGVMHCFSGGPDEMRRAVDLDYDVSFAGPVTYPRSAELRDACRDAPADRIHLETDCPFLPPQGRRGKRNEPSYLDRLAAVVADVRGTTVEEIDRLTTANTRRLFRLSGGGSGS